LCKLELGRQHCDVERACEKNKIEYVLSPIDLIPDFIPVLGYLDEIIILPALVVVTIKYISDEVWQRSKDKAVDIWKEGKPKKWYYAVPIAAIWVLLIWLAVKVI